MVSLFPKINVLTGGTEADILTILQAIQSGRWKDQVEQVRAAKDLIQRRELKKALPYFTVSGTFTKRGEAGLKQHSGYVAMDIDHDLTKMEEVAADPYTFACVVSAGGDGFFSIVKIPPAKTPASHNASFRALQRYYLEQYEIKVDSLPDVSRARFVSYDPNLYINTESEVFTETYTEPAFTPPSRPQYPAPSVPTDHGHTALATAVRKILEAPAGDKHHTRKRMAYLCGGYVATGLLSESEVRDALEAAVRQSSPQSAWKDAFSTIASGIRKGQEKPILPEPLEYVVRTGRRHGDQKELVTQKIIVSNGGNSQAIAQVVEEIYAEKEVSLKTFWDVAYQEKKDVYLLFLSRVKYAAFLEESGYRKFKLGQRYITVRVRDNVVQEVHRAEIKNYVMSYLQTLPFEFDNIFRSQLIDQVMKEHKSFFDEGMMEFLLELPDNFVRDAKPQSYFFFKNGFVSVTKNGIELKNYDELPGLIWAQQVLDREFELMDPDEVNEACDFYQFLFNITGQSAERLMTLLTAIGYLLHGYKAPSNAKIVCLVDEAISDVPQGGTGKSLVFQAVSKMREMVTLDGKNVDFKDRFLLQEVSQSTRILFFDDWDGKRLPFDRLFVMATGEMKLHKMYLGAMSIPYAESPKIGVATNDMVGGEGDSHARRKLEIEIAPHYHKDFTPADEFGHEFFTDWSEADWNIFDNLMVGCCQLFMAKGLKAPKAINLNRRKLLQATNSEFVSFCDGLNRKNEYGKKALWAEFIDTYGFDPKQVTQVRFSRWLKTYASLEGLELVEWQNKTAGEDFNKYFIVLQNSTSQL